MLASKLAVALLGVLMASGSAATGVVASPHVQGVRHGPSTQHVATMRTVSTKEIPSNKYSGPASHPPHPKTTVFVGPRGIICAATPDGFGRPLN